MSLEHITRRTAMKLLLASGATIALSNTLALAKDVGKAKLVIGMSEEPVNFNPLMPHVETDEGVHHAIFDKLFAIDEAGMITSSLAMTVPTVENGGISADGLTWQVKLRHDVKWHDGEVFTAEDVKFTLELAVDPAFRSGRRNGHDMVQNITVMSPTELTWKMSQAFSPYLSILASTFIVPKHLLAQAADKNTAPFNNAPVGTGPFKWVNRVAGDHIEMAANEQYFAEGPHIKSLIYKYIPDATVLYTQFRTGDVDAVSMSYISPDFFGEAKTLIGKSVTIAPTATIEILMLNLSRPQFKEKAVRQALYMAIDKDSIINALYYGIPTATETYMSRQLIYHNPDLPAHEYNLAQAKKVLNNAGWAPGDDGVRSKNGIRLTFSVSTTAGDHLREQTQQVIQQSFSEIGVEMTISNYPPAVMWGEFFFQSQFDIALAGVPFLTGGDPDTSEYFSSKAIPVQGGGGMNTAQFSDPRIDRLLEEGAGSFSVEKRKAVYFEIQRILRDELTFFPIYQRAFVYGNDSKLNGNTPNPNTQINTWNIASWHWN